MVGSIDGGCETVSGIHWPKKGREVVWSSRRGNHLGQRPKATASTGRTYGCKRSDQTLKKLLWHGGRPHMGPGARGACHRAGQRPDPLAWPGRREIFVASSPCRITVSAIARRPASLPGCDGKPA